MTSPRVDIRDDLSTHDPWAAVLDTLATGDGHDLRACIQLYGGLLLTLAHRYSFPDPEEAVYLAFLDVRACCSTWPGSRLGARTWVVGVGKRCYDRLAQVPPAAQAVGH